MSRPRFALNCKLGTDRGQLFPGLKPDQQGSAGLCTGVLGYYQKHRGRRLDGSLKTKPGSQRHTPRRRVRYIAEINRHQPKTSALQKQIGDAQRLLDRSKVRRAKIRRAKVRPWVSDVGT